MSRRKTRDLVWVCPIDEGVLVPDDRGLCPRQEEHTPAPRSYLAWHHWAMRMMATHRPRRHEPCGLWAVWAPKRA